MKKFPVGISTLNEIINDNYYYVDKTSFIAKLANTGKYYFLSRLRRFGKSLLIDTFKQAFLGNKGRIDLTVIIQNTVCIFELKLCKNNSNIDSIEALEQIKQRNYAQKYIGKYEKIYLIGIEFDEQERNLINFKYELI